MERVIYHIDCNSFFASVECMERPELNGVPMAVAGDAENRHGIILAKNEMARGFGVKTAETIYQARRKCPQLVLVPPHGRRYAEVSRQVKRLFYEYTDQVESFGMDEAWLDVTGSLRYFQSTPVQLADAIRQRVKREIGITVSVGVSFNKAFAKLGSDMKKPDGTTLISRENFHRRVWPLPADELLFVGKNAGEKLKRHCIDTIGDIARCEPAFLEQLLGKGGDMLWRYANGYDDAPVRRMGEREPPKSIGNGMTFRRDLLGWDEVKRGILALTDEVASRLRESGVKCSRLQMMIRDPSLKSITRQCSLTRPTHLQKELVDAAMRLMRAHWQENAPVRALAVTALGLCRDEEAAEQLVWNHPDEQQLNRLENAESAMWKLREKYGSHCLAMGYVESEELGIRPFHREARQPSFTHDE